MPSAFRSFTRFRVLHGIEVQLANPVTTAAKRKYRFSLHEMVIGEALMM
jgi:hypothetical protein